GRYSSGDPCFGHSGGGDSVWFADTDQMLCGGGREGNGHYPLQLFAAGSNGQPDLQPVTTPNPPRQVYGAGGTFNSGKFLIDPNNPTRLLMLEKQGDSLVWASSDRGLTWQLQSYKHPF